MYPSALVVFVYFIQRKYMESSLYAKKKCNDYKKKKEAN